MKYFLTFFLLVSFFCLTAQTNFHAGWHLKDIHKDGYYGISLDEAYRFLENKKLKGLPVVVAILDDGIDTSHEDLQTVLWVNKREIPGNGADDDGNGYADDVYGWNFLGNPDGRNVLSNSSEWIRVYWRFKDKYESRQVDTTMLSFEERHEYAMWQKARSGVVGKGMKEEELENLQLYLVNAAFCDSILQLNLKTKEFTQAQLEKWAAESKMEKDIKAFYLEIFKQFTLPGITNQFVMDELKKYVTGELRRASGGKVPPEDTRREITGDDDTNINHRWYGNHDNTNGELMHGTHLAGIVAADRNNNNGMKGIAGNVKIMMVRTSAEGDEYDKDIAAGIRYAVDNGAKVINMSFGKSLSPDKKFVDDAVKYALQNNVLLVQAAGNSKRNIDAFDNFPNPKFMLTDSMAPNWITVGASDTAGKVADFSNYGKQLVNLFAPGVAIYSSIPSGNKYMSWDGTSMAAPVVTGIAALLLSYFPDLTAIEIKQILEQSVSVPIVESVKPGTTEKAMMKALSSGGGIVNAYKAVQHAFKRSK